jgi:hypothetical protein
VRVEREEIRQCEAVELLGRSDGGQSAVGAVDMEPQIVRPRHLGDACQRVDRAGYDRAGRRHDRDRPSPRATVVRDRCLQIIETHPEVVVHGNQSEIRPAQAERRHCLRHGHVNFLGGVDDAGLRTLFVCRRPGLARHRPAHQVGR